jgi:hypothetical protein
LLGYERTADVGPVETPPIDLPEQVRQLQGQVRNLKRIVIGLAVVVIALLAAGGSAQRIFEGFTAVTMIVGALIGVLVIIFGGARFLEKRFPPPQP